jgi:hypothetical protein
LFLSVYQKNSLQGSYDSADIIINAIKSVVKDPESSINASQKRAKEFDRLIFEEKICAVVNDVYSAY